uniref:Transmembrane protein 104 n=2 Tax=Parasteatoda tepidariorum TaxID=114398 RepID=A0A2L2Y1L4_PARTP
MPSPIAEAGWLLSLIILIVLAFMSFVTVTFMTESMAAANAVLHFRTVKHLKKIIKNEDVIIDDCGGQQLVEQFDNDEVICNSSANEKVPLLLNSVDTIAENSTEYFNITVRIEMGKMAMLFFNKIGVNIFYVCIAGR